MVLTLKLDKTPACKSQFDWEYRYFRSAGSALGERFRKNGGKEQAAMTAGHVHMIMMYDSRPVPATSAGH
jgi:hypothetical protein